MHIRRIKGPQDNLPIRGRSPGRMIGPKRPPKPRPRVSEQPIWFIDGEGQGSNPHVYTFLAAACEDGRTLQTRFAQDGLTTIECLDFLISIPSSRAFGYSLGYDWTMILTDLAMREPKKAWELVHEESREFKAGERIVRRKVLYGRFGLDWLNGQVTLYSGRYAKKKWRHRLQVWDVFRFFGSRFTTALELWGIESKDKLERMYRMKAERGSFDQQTPAEVMAYCLEECHYGAKLVRALIESHNDVDLRLKSFFGPGSTAKVLLAKLNVADHLMADSALPRPLQHAVSCAFFGGRFEISRAGPIEQPVYSADIASAYPYQISALPCLTCGKWERVTKSITARVREATLACVQVQSEATHQDVAWGAIPWRHETGTISFPVEGGTSWVWKDEFLQALQCPGLRPRPLQAWVYHTKCNHHPFDHFPSYYNERLAMGKDGKGLALKLGLNSGYGVMVQRKGTRRFRSLVWAGNVTSGTRAMLLQVLNRMSNPWDLVMMATDAVYSLSPLDLLLPRDTGTAVIAKEKGKQPLGAWDEKTHGRGMFLMRSGVYFPLEPTEDDLKDCRARGLSRNVLYKHADAILAHWNRHARGKRLPPDYQVDGTQTRFVGLRAAFSIYQDNPKLRMNEKGDIAQYGEWLPFQPKLSYDPAPKRMAVLDGWKLAPWRIPGMTDASSGYDPDLKDEETIAIERALAIADDQPDGDVL